MIGLEILASHYAYALMFVLLGVGLYMMIANENLVKKVIGVNLFQTAIFLFFVSVAYVEVDGEPGDSPVVPAEVAPGELFVASPLPHVIVLTAIVVGVALTAVALALIVRIYSEYGTLREDTLREVRADE
ncbi:cation:proton antiporter subunit C [Natronobiforma cellulositropha]|uniref:cation:proton antiporter subunit C n=1 Tax=Natronobiforma cellulositropha TaxID=1679076 RepID=UPI0021D5B878|nr:cation:proton antiporter subunit C [Natronobiforma cellulositropha]